MNWLARLKKIEINPKPEPTETTKTVSVVFVGSISAPAPKIGGDSIAANDSALTPMTAVAGVDLIPQKGVKALTTTPAMPGRDADTFTARVIRFTSKGMSLTDGETLANKLAIRDRELDDRRLCLECTHLAGYGAGPWSCRAWSRAGVAIKARDAGLPGDLVQQLQRCDGFTTATQQFYPQSPILFTNHRSHHDQQNH